MEAYRLDSPPDHLVLGSGRRTLVVAGGVHLDHSYLRPWLDRLARSARLVYFDQRGTGRTPVDDPDRLDHALWVADIEWLRDALGAERIVLLGHSYGGFIAQEYVLAHPDRLEGLILCSTSPAMDYPEVVMANAAAAGDPALVRAAQEALHAPLSDDDAVRRACLALAPLYYHRFDPEVAAAMDRQASYSAVAWNRGFFGCLPRFRMVGRLGEVRVPTLLLTGRHDWICPVEEGTERIRAEIPHADVTVFEESGHYPFIEETDPFVFRVERWLAELDEG